MLRFYLPDKKEISKEKFVEKYSKDYFLKDQDDKYLVPRLHRSSEHIENEINNILRNEIREGEEGRIDIVRILAWKTGKINHCESNHYKTFVYRGNWKGVEQQINCATFRGGYPISNAVSYLVDNKRDLEQLAKNDQQGFLNNIEKNKNFMGIGPVYGITLMYFLSQGIVPIYDRFAMTALSAIIQNIQPDLKEKVKVKVKYKNLPEKNTNRYSSIMSTEMKDYKKLLKEVFGDKWNTSRKYDQALWVYGHLFEPVIKPNDNHYTLDENM